MSKKIKGYIKLQIRGGAANPAPPVGPALGAKGVNIMEFCKAFNAATQANEPGTPIPTIITVYEDNSFTFVCKTPPASFYLKKYAKIKKGAKATKKEGFVGTINFSDCKEIAKIKVKDLNCYDVDSGAKIIAGSAESMGLEIIHDNEV
jgi:large subunit ribosomal protein L11